MDQHLPSNADAVIAWIFWAETLERSDAADLVVETNSAIVALNRVYEHHFPQDEMDTWLKRWPTSFGMEQFQRVAGD